MAVIGFVVVPVVVVVVVAVVVATAAAANGAGRIVSSIDMVGDSILSNRRTKPPDVAIEGKAVAGPKGTASVPDRGDKALLQRRFWGVHRSLNEVQNGSTVDPIGTAGGYR